jgi:hypothetical protein
MRRAVRIPRATTAPFPGSLWWIVRSTACLTRIGELRSYSLCLTVSTGETIMTMSAPSATGADPMVEMNTTPLIDVMMVLLILFIGE